MRKVGVVIPVGPGRTLTALETLKQQEEKVDIFVEKGTNTSENRNRGIKKSKNEIIAFINAHTILPKDWSKRIRMFFEQNPKIDIVGGPQLTPPYSNFFEKISGYALSSVFGAAEVSTRYKIKKQTLDANEKYLTSSNLACRKKVFKKIKFDEKIYPGEDPKFISDAKKENIKIAYSPDIIVYNERRKDIGSLAKQIFNYGKTRPLKESLFDTLKKPSFLMPSLFLLYVLLLWFLFLISWIFVIPLFIYLALNIFFSVFEGVRNRDVLAIFMLPGIFYTIHVSYGLGFLCGTVKMLSKDRG